MGMMFIWVLIQRNTYVCVRYCYLLCVHMFIYVWAHVCRYMCVCGGSMGKERIASGDIPSPLCGRIFD